MGTQEGSLALPELACCRSCAYLLRGLTQPACPECGQAFDPADPSTYAISQRARRSRRALRIVGALALLGLFYAVVGPRGVRQTTITLSCARCSLQLQANRYELAAPGWIHVRYPGFNLAPREIASGPATTQPTGRCAHRWDSIRFSSGGLGAACTCGAGFLPAANGVLVDPQTIEAALYPAGDPERMWRLHCIPAPTAAP